MSSSINVTAISPTVTGIAPATGSTLGGTSVAITGSGFTGVTAVTFGGTNATSFTFNSDTSITATAPNGSGIVDVRVTNASGTSSASGADQFTYIPNPLVTGISPTFGSTAGGTVVTITGTNLLNTTSITFGGTAAASFTINSSTSITATTAPRAAGSASITVTTPGGSSAGTQYTYIAPVTATQSVPSAMLTQGHAATAFTPVTGSGGTAPYTYSVSPTLPARLNFSTSGAITGTPSVTSTATTYTVTVTDATSATATNSFTLTVHPALLASQAIVSTILTQNHATTGLFPVIGSGGTAPLAYSVSPPCRRDSISRVRRASSQALRASRPRLRPTP